MTCVGADEAGKGPVLGPMVAAAVRADPTTLPDGIDDSKRVSPGRRETVVVDLRARDDVAVGVGVVPTDRIDDPETDMNSLTVAAQVEAVAAVARGGDTVVVDAGDVSEARFGRRVREGVAAAGVDVDVVSEHGADESHDVVGAASIVAKVERDRRVEAIAEEYAAYGDVGSGYPSDPTTREFLKRYVADTGDLPECARRSWSTCADLLAANEQSSLAEF
ncbi:RNase HII [Halogranum amylolyticum]|uniref:Ribonuclease HII n=1 Tax=Halogranum amylolyticum TaxID=660520 RepID=A0A1H8W275_9EURY|nr:ribonuclease HII [Halogranum amylolyticum]SEP21587.1 RNase HII [Halogranum amylolyticum]